MAAETRRLKWSSIHRMRRREILIIHEICMCFTRRIILFYNWPFIFIHSWFIKSSIGVGLVWIRYESVAELSWPERMYEKSRIVKAYTPIGVELILRIHSSTKLSGYDFRSEERARIRAIPSEVFYGLLPRQNQLEPINVITLQCLQQHQCHQCPVLLF